VLHGEREALVREYIDEKRKILTRGPIDVVVKLFLFGLPGSGKSTVSRSIVDHVNRTYKQWSVQRVCDYNILFDMFRQDTKRKNFYPVKHSGFYVTNPSMYDVALNCVEQSINRINPKGNKLLVIEFSRGDYAEALKNFDSSFFDNAAYLFLYADINTCLERIAQRVKDPQSIDDHFVPERTIERFAAASTEEYAQLLCTRLENNYRGKNSRFLIIDSGESKNNTLLQAHSFADKIIRDGYLLRDWEVAEIKASEPEKVQFVFPKYVLARS
jgi:adenylate kinase family enzyme